jgi:hypothetical protein
VLQPALASSTSALPEPYSVHSRLAPPTVIIRVCIVEPNRLVVDLAASLGRLTGGRHQLPPQDPEFAANLEAETAVKGHCRRVLRSHMQEGLFAAAQRAFCQGVSQACSQTSASSVRMNRYCAQLDMAGKPHTLTGHCDEACATANTDKAAELRCARAEWPWFRDFGKLHHRSQIIVGEIDGRRADRGLSR